MRQTLGVERVEVVVPEFVVDADGNIEEADHGGPHISDQAASVGM